MTTQLTKDQVYDTVDPRDFPALLDIDRYGKRSSAFDKIIAATHDHFWDPLDKAYIDFSEPFDMEKDYLIDPDLVAGRGTAVWDKLDEAQRIKLTNLDAKWALSSILHGEQGALSLSASLCHILRDPGAQEYAANQAREEARHVTAFAQYVKVRWGKPMPIGGSLGGVLNELVASPYAWKKIVGMQLLVEGLAMGAFATFYNRANDPVLVRLCQLAMTDEAFHHKFGKIWADRTIPKLSKEEQNIVEDWAASCFQTLLFNLINPEQMKSVYALVGIDWQEAHQSLMEAITDEHRRERMREGTDIF
ncbi:MAG TPA: DUF3066 domain-containing protein, partial [Alphaproteobacteria bacterium]|nr:DUF3066 domain-containing protein [Alphaproteobacteria bacterium]